MIAWINAIDVVLNKFSLILTKFWIFHQRLWIRQIFKMNHRNVGMCVYSSIEFIFGNLHCNPLSWVYCWKQHSPPWDESIYKCVERNFFFSRDKLKPKANCIHVGAFHIVTNFIRARFLSLSLSLILEMNFQLFNETIKSIELMICFVNIK